MLSKGAEVEVSKSQARASAASILFVAGAIETRAPLAEFLRTNGYQVFESATADEALELLNSRLEIDALVADDQVTGSMGGLALADWVRKTRPSMRVLVISNNAHESDNSAISLARPFHPAALLAMLPPTTPGA
jgi:CheY-like chemotaxis protein